MALDPSEVEAAWGTVWMTLAKCADGHTLADFRCAKFRRAKPKRSRVQEMAERNYRESNDCAGNKYFEAERVEHYGEAIRAVCEWQREQWSECKSAHVIGPAAIEREFLVPR
jgi:hypothetical protein